jgi:broad specificity phosphatase PhoE
MANDVTLNIYWIRHGFSCANYVKATSWIPFSHTFIPDPKLHCDGVGQAMKLGKYFKRINVKFDLICSSMLLRAMQTALLIYNEQSKGPCETTKEMNEEEKKEVVPIHVLPYIAEKGSTVDNIPKWIHTGYKPLQYGEIDGLHYNSNELSNHELFDSKVLPQLINYLRKMSDNSADRNFNVAIVSHHHFLEKSFGKFFNNPIKIENCQYITQSVKMVNGIIESPTKNDFTFHTFDTKITKEKSSCGCDNTFLGLDDAFRVINVKGVVDKVDNGEDHIFKDPVVNYERGFYQPGLKWWFKSTKSRKSKKSMKSTKSRKSKKLTKSMKSRKSSPKL